MPSTLEPNAARQGHRLLRQIAAGAVASVGHAIPGRAAAWLLLAGLGSTIVWSAYGLRLIGRQTFSLESRLMPVEFAPSIATWLAPVSLVAAIVLCAALVSCRMGFGTGGFGKNGQGRLARAACLALVLALGAGSIAGVAPLLWALGYGFLGDPGYAKSFTYLFALYAGASTWRFLTRLTTQQPAEDCTQGLGSLLVSAAFPDHRPGNAAAPCERTQTGPA